jgi:hypothetical protein
MSPTVAFDAEPLFHDLEAQEPRRFHVGDALDQVPALVTAANETARGALVPLTSQRQRQEQAKQRPGSPRYVLVEHQALPNGF